MRKIRLGRTDQRVSAIGLGTWSFGGAKTVGGRQVGWTGHDDASALAALERAAARGIDHWDTADVYGDGLAERLVGRLWAQVPRDQIFLASKVGWDRGAYDHVYDPRLIRERLERSLALLQTDRLDLYYLHHCDFGPGDRYLDAAVEVLERARAEGKIRFLGLSDWSCAKLLRVARRMDPDVVQAYRNLLDDEFASSGLSQWVVERDVGVAFFSPLKHGLLLGKFTRPTEFGAGDMRNDIPGFRDAELLQALVEARRQLERRFRDHPQPVLLALTGALLSDTPTASVLVGMRSGDQAEAAGELGDALGGDDLGWVRDLYSRLR